MVAPVALALVHSERVEGGVGACACTACRRQEIFATSDSLEVPSLDGGADGGGDAGVVHGG